jgi:hypothetical protein
LQNTLDPKQAMIIGTNRLGRAFTDAERDHFASELHAHDYVGASSIALRFAFKLRPSQAAARELLSRANVQLVTLGWDPTKVLLRKRMCRLVWCEHHHVLEEDAAMRRAEEVYLHEMAITEGVVFVVSGESNVQPQVVGRSIEDHRVRLEEETAQEAKASSRLDELKASFEEAKDEVNLLWLQYSRDGETSLQKMAELSKRPVRDFYLATDRRKAHVNKLLPAKGGPKT